MKSLFVNLLLLCAIMAQAQTIVENPTFKARSGSIKNITKIERNATCTKLYIHAIFRPGWWIIVEKDHYLQDVISGKKYALTGAEGITLEKKTTMPKSGMMDFILLFEPLPKETQTIHWVTPNDTEGNVFDISLSAPKKKPQTPLQLIRGNWFATDAPSSWVAGFYDNLVLINHRMYSYQSIEKKGKRIRLTLKDRANGLTETFNLTLRKERAGAQTEAPSASPQPLTKERRRHKVPNEKERSFTLQIEKAGEQAEATPASPQLLTKNSRPHKEAGEEPDFTTFFRTDSACIQGYIDGYDPRIGLETGMIYLENTLTREDYPTVVTIRPDGSFQCKFPLNYPVEKDLLLENNHIPFYIEPGQTLTLYIDWEEVLKYNRQRDRYASIENIQYMGASAALSKILHTHDALLSASFQDRISTLQKKLTPEEFLVYMQPRRDRWAALTDSLCRLHQGSPKAVHLMRNKLKIKEGYVLLDFSSYRRHAAQTEPDNKALQVKETPAYYGFLKEMPLDDATLLADGDAAMFINRFEFMEPLNKVYRTRSAASMPDSIPFTYPKKGVLTFFKEKGVKLTPTQEKMRQRDELLAGRTVYINPKNLIAEQKFLQDLFRKEESLLKAYTELAKADVTEVREEEEKNRAINNALRISREQDSIMTFFCGKSLPLMWQVAKVRSLKFHLTGFNNRGLAAKYLQEVKSTLTHPFLLAEADRMFRLCYPEGKEETYRLPEGQGTEIFRRIIRNHPGKVLFVDFWATSCGPCRGGIEATAELRERYRNHPEFQFIYITSQDGSPEKDYHAYVEKHLKGEASYYLKPSEFQYLRQLFHFNAIPHYELVEKDGSISQQEHNAYQLKEYLTKRFGTK